jgi:hypothetical protein
MTTLLGLKKLFSVYGGNSNILSTRAFCIILRHFAMPKVKYRTKGNILPNPVTLIFSQFAIKA